MRRQRKKLLSLCTDCVQLPGLSPLQHKGRVLISFQDACFLHACAVSKVFSGGSVVKNPPATARAVGLILGLGGFPGGRNGNPCQYSCLENPMDRGAWWLQSMESQRVVHNWGTEHTHRIENTGKDGVLDNISKETKGKKKREFSREKMRA